MYQDTNLNFATAWAETTAASHASSIDIDCEEATPNMGEGRPLWVNVVVDTTYAGGTAPTLQVALQDSADDSTYADLLKSEAYAKASCVAGFVLMSVPLPAEHKRYLRIAQIIGTSAFTAGAINAWIGLAPMKTY